MSDINKIDKEEPKKEFGFVKRILPAHKNSINDVFVNNHSKLTATFAICRNLLDHKVDYLILHGMGKSIAKTICLANLLKDTMKDSIKLDTRVGTVTAKDIYYGKFDEVDPVEGKTDAIRERLVSVINIRVVRVYN